MDQIANVKVILPSWVKWSPKKGSRLMQHPITETVNRCKARVHSISLISPQELILCSPCLWVALRTTAIC